MLIPSIDLLGGRIVQLIQGEKKAIESNDFDSWIDRFKQFPLIQLIDLDAALGQGNNGPLISEICGRLPCQVGGGLRSARMGADLFTVGARRVIFGSSLIKDGTPDVAFAEGLARELGRERLVFAVDVRAGHIVIKGWREQTGLAPEPVMAVLEPFCSAFLCTNVDTEGLMHGFPLELARRLRAATRSQLIVAGGISSSEEVARLESLGADSVVGMAIYTGAMSCASQHKSRL